MEPVRELDTGLSGKNIPGEGTEGGAGVLEQSGGEEVLAGGGWGTREWQAGRG